MADSYVSSGTVTGQTAGNGTDAETFGDALPSRDLLLSSDHGLFIDGALIPAKALINNRNIRQLDRRAALEAARKTTLRHYYERRASRA